MPTTMIAETPKGSQNWDERDHETGRIRLDGMLLMATRDSADCGFSSHTLADGIPTHLPQELEHFGSVDEDLEDKKTAKVGWRPLSDSSKLRRHAREGAF